MTTATVTRHACPGFRPQPLASYLAGLGSVRMVRWECDQPGEQRQALAKLAELLPYLGRSESVCEARLADGDVLPDETCQRPKAMIQVIPAEIGAHSGLDGGFDSRSRRWPHYRPP